MDTEPHCIIGRIVTRRGRSGLPESHREVECCQERHVEWFTTHGGWMVLIRDSEIPLAAPEVDPAQRNPNRTGDDSEC